MDNELPLTVGSYRVTAGLGAVPDGTAYRSEEPGSGAALVIKVLAPPEPRDRDRWLRQLAETRRLTRLDRPGIPTVLEVGDSEQGVFIAFAPPPGRPLAEFVTAGGRVDRQRLIEWGSQLLGLLAECHAEGILHRHLGVEAVLIDGDGQIGLTGFSLTQLTADSPELRPPEQGGEAELTAAADLYAVGALLRRLAAPEGMGGAADQELAPDDPLRSVLAKATAEDAADRFQDAAEMEKAVRSAGARPPHEEAETASSAAATGDRRPPADPNATRMVPQLGAVAPVASTGGAADSGGAADTSGGQAPAARRPPSPAAGGEDAPRPDGGTPAGDGGGKSGRGCGFWLLLLLLVIVGAAVGLYFWLGQPPPEEILPRLQEEIDRLSALSPALPAVAPR